jgi:hypothetical protein
MIMYYNERFDAAEMHTVLTSMREAFVHAELGKMEVAHSTICEWARAIRAQFDVDNLHLTARQAHGMSEQVVATMQHLHQAQETLQAQVAEIAGRLVRIETSQGQIIEMLSSLLSRGASPVARGAICPSPVVPPATVPAVPPAAVPPATVPALTARPHPLLQAGWGSGAGAVAATYELPKGPGQFYLDCLAQHVPPGVLDCPFIKGDSLLKRKSDAKKVLDAYVAMTLPDELKVLTSKPRQMVLCGPMVSQLTSLIVAIIKHAYSANRIVCPKQFGKGDVKINTLVANLRDSKIIVESGYFRRWRAERNSPGAAGSSNGVGERRVAEDEPDESPARKSPRPLGPPGKEDSLASGGSEGEEEEEEGEGEEGLGPLGSPQRPFPIL